MSLFMDHSIRYDYNDEYIKKYTHDWNPKKKEGRIQKWFNYLFPTNRQEHHVMEKPDVYPEQIDNRILGELLHNDKPLTFIERLILKERNFFNELADNYFYSSTSLSGGNSNNSNGKGEPGGILMRPFKSAFHILYETLKIPAIAISKRISKTDEVLEYRISSEEKFGDRLKK